MAVSASNLLAAQGPTAPAGRAPTEMAATTARPVNNNAPVDAALIMQRSGGSLLRASLSAAPDPNQAKLSQISFFSVPEPEPRTIKKHDLLTIVIREESAFTSKGTADIKRQADLSAQIDQFIKLKLGNFAIQGGAQGATPPAIQMSDSRNFKGEGTIDRSDTLTARITGEVLDVKPNGTLILQAKKEIRTDDEVQQFILTGTCRAEDVTADNTVLTTQMSDLQLQKNHKGAVRDATKRGWLHKVLDTLNPF
jgi:flagellar L-ring protein precursor FlgH